MFTEASVVEIIKNASAMQTRTVSFSTYSAFIVIGIPMIPKSKIRKKRNGKGRLRIKNFITCFLVFCLL